MQPLSVIQPLSCAGCGVCCSYAGVPPGYGRFYLSDPAELLESDWETSDGARWRAMPEPVRAELTTYGDALAADEVADRSEEVTPCLWFDPAARGCRHYEWRPQVCRDFEMGGRACLAARQAQGIDA